MSGKADGDLATLHDDRDLPLPPGQAEHLLELLRILVDVHIDRPVAVDRPGLLYIGSGVGAVDNDLVHHRVILDKFLSLSLEI